MTVPTRSGPAAVQVLGSAVPRPRRRAWSARGAGCDAAREGRGVHHSMLARSPGARRRLLERLLEHCEFLLGHGRAARDELRLVRRHRLRRRLGRSRCRDLTHCRNKLRELPGSTAQELWAAMVPQRNAKAKLRAERHSHQPYLNLQPGKPSHARPTVQPSMLGCTLDLQNTFQPAQLARKPAAAGAARSGEASPLTSPDPPGREGLTSPATSWTHQNLNPASSHRFACLAIPELRGTQEHEEGQAPSYQLFPADLPKVHLCIHFWSELPLRLSTLFA